MLDILSLYTECEDRICSTNSLFIYITNKLSVGKSALKLKA